MGKKWIARSLSPSCQQVSGGGDGVHQILLSAFSGGGETEARMLLYMITHYIDHNTWQRAYNMH